MKMKNRRKRGIENEEILNEQLAFRITFIRYIYNFVRYHEGQITDFFSYTFLEITKKSHIKITKSQTNYLQKAQKITNH